MRRHKPAAGPPGLVRREDYRPPDWRVPEIVLEFELDPARTRVKARFEVIREGSHRLPLRLDGAGLKLLSLRVDGRAAAHQLDKTGLTIRLAGDRAAIETLAEIAPGRAQLGLFEADGLLCTQCEPEGFRRITFFPDRPDVLARYRVRLTADRTRYPVLLSNGNPAGAGDLADGRHWAEWDDPFPKPSYLFALVAGDLAANRSAFVTATGRQVELAVWTRAGDLPRTGHIMTSLQAAMRWDEEVYGRHYDLDTFNIVAFAGFAFGAMENKGLVLFDSANVLVDPETATDAGRDRAATLVAHEYFHNWSGNRVTLRDWFQLPLKEGLTVFRDQCFAADRGSPAVKRIEDVRALRAAQFAGDAGPHARPVRAEAYAAVAELFTATTYIKGAEIVRMLHRLLGPAAFRAGADLYFARNDGKAVTCEDLLAAMAEASGTDLAAFQAWYAQAGTPRLRAALRHDRDARRAIVTLAQEIPRGGRPLPIPVATALFGAASGARLAERLLLLEAEQAEFVFDGIAEPPLLSLNRGFSAPVIVEAPQGAAAFAALARHDDDPFARQEAMQQLMLATLLDDIEGRTPDPQPVIEAVRHLLEAGGEDRGLVAETVRLPTEAELGDRMAVLDPDAVHAALARLRAALGRALEPDWRAAVDPSGEDAGARRLRAVALSCLLAAGADGAGAMALNQLREADNMTDREAALRALADSDARERPEALAWFHQRYRDQPMLLDTWFMAQALSLRADTVEAAPRLIAHPDFTLAHPTRLSALVGAFVTNLHAFHHRSGRGYRFLADVVLAIDRLNPAAAASLALPLTRHPRLDSARTGLIQNELGRIRAAPGLSAALAARIAPGPGAGGQPIAIS